MRIATCVGLLATLTVVVSATAQAPIAIVAENVEGVVIKGSGYWLMDEAPDQVVPKLLAFFRR